MSIIISISLCNLGVSKAILDAAGVQVEQECSQIGLYSLKYAIFFLLMHITFMKRSNCRCYW